MRRNTRSTRFFRFASIAVMAALPYASPPRYAFAFEGENDGGVSGGTGNGNGSAGGAGEGGTGGGAGAGGAGGAGDAGGANPPRRGKQYNEQEFGAATRARDVAKKKLIAVIRALGLDPDDVTIAESDDPENPFIVEGLDEIVEAARKSGGAGDSEAKKRADADRKKRIVAPVERKLRSAEKKVAALTDWIARNAIVSPIRSACIAEKIVDDDGGKYADIVALLKPRFKTTVELDEDDREATATISIVAMNEEGDDAIDGATGDPWEDARKMVAALARSRPKYKQSEFRGGPGAGGARLGARGNGTPGAITPDAKHDRLVRNASGHYGIRPEEIGESVR